MFRVGLVRMGMEGRRRQMLTSFVDLGLIFEYSRGLARCCACGLGVFIRTLFDGVSGQVLAAPMEQATGCGTTGERGPAQPGLR